MAQEHSEKAREIFDRARGMHPDAREAFVTDACAGDEELLADVRDYLSAYENDHPVPAPRGSPPRGTHFVPDGATTTDVNAGARATRLGGTTSASFLPVGSYAARLPRVVGPYRILGTLGEGGMGIVFRGQPYGHR